MKYPLIVIALFAIVAVIFWDDIKVLITKTKNVAFAKFKSNTNNPFNIRSNSANNWKGKTTAQGAAFESFDKLENGVRAGIMILKRYFQNYKLNTVHSIISRFAPSNENDTENYIKFVSDQMGVEKFDQLEWNKTTAWNLSKAICKMENGYNLKEEDFNNGWKLV